MSRVLPILLFAVALQFIAVEQSFGQTTDASIIRSDEHVRKSPRANESSRVNTELRRQQKFLRDVAARYEAVSVHDLTPLLSYTYVWRALRENRARLVTPNSHLSSEQIKLVERGYDLLETDVLLSFVDHQISVLNETLELDELQYSALEKILSTDLNQKRALLSDKTVNSASFGRRLQVFSDQTEKRIVSILQPEQRKSFYKHLVLNRDRLVG